MKWIGACLLGLLLSACAGVGSVVEKPRISLAGLDVEGMGLFEQRFAVVLRVSNPNDFSVTLDGVDFSLDLNGEHFASGMSREAVTLPRMGNATVKLRVTTRLDTLLKQARTLQSRDKPLGYQLTGKVYGAWIPGGIPFERKGELPALKKIIPGRGEKQGPNL